MTIDKTVFTVPGFRASAIAAGIKKGNALDMALISSDGEVVAAGVFTKNKIKAAPVILCREQDQGCPGHPVQ